MLKDKIRGERVRLRARIRSILTYEGIRPPSEHGLVRACRGNLAVGCDEPVLCLAFVC